MPRAYLVYNPIAGRYPSWLLTERAADVLRAHDWELNLERSQSGEHITRLARQAADQGMDAFIVVGGDGSINYAIQGLVGTPTMLGVLPGGTANVWAQELGLPGLTWTRFMALEESARLLAAGAPAQVDIGLCNQQAFLLWAGIGLDAFIVHRLEPRRPWEKHFAVLHYAASAIWTASNWRGMQLEVEADGKTISGQFLLAVVSNVHLYIGGYSELSPDARLDDGKMDLWLFRGEALADIVQLAWDLLSGHHLQSERVERVSFRHLKFHSVSPMYVQVDGEPVAAKGETSIDVRPQALRVLVPRQTPHVLFSDQDGSGNQPARGNVDT